MKFLRYCYEIDINTDADNCISFGDRNIFGYEINDNVYLKVRGVPTLFCLFYNDSQTELTNDFLCKWGNNVSVFIKDTIGTVINLALAIDVPNILRSLKIYETGCLYDPNSVGMYTVTSRPFIELRRLDNSFFITVDGNPLYNRGIVNEKVANDLFKKLSGDITEYIKKRWPIE